MGAHHLSLVLLLCLAFAGTVYSDVNGFNAKIQAAIDEYVKETGATDDSPVSIQKLDPVGVKDFDCPALPTTEVPTSVHELTPDHVQVIAALGDSVTAAFGARACNIFDGPLTEYRDVSWSIGGYGDLASCATVPNIIKKYNPAVIGYSIGSGSETSGNAQMNVAVSGAIAQNMPAQAAILVEKLTADSLQAEWKVVTLWIGGNNLCDYCNDDKHATENYINNIKAALDILFQLPNTFVNLVQIIDVSRIAALMEDNLLCGLVHLFACGCAQRDPSGVTKATKEYQQAIIDLVESGKYDDPERDDFTVVVQPFFRDVDLPENPLSYFAPDCFHFNVKGHREAAVALWNNMVEPVGAKSTNWEMGQPIKCPNKNFPVLYTKKNSQVANSQAFEGETAEEEDGKHHSHDDHLDAILGGSITGYIVVATVVLVIGTVWAVRRRRARASVTPTTVPTDKTSLITKTTSL